MRHEMKRRKGERLGRVEARPFLLEHKRDNFFLYRVRSRESGEPTTDDNNLSHDGKLREKDRRDRE